MPMNQANVGTVTNTCRTIPEARVQICYKASTKTCQTSPQKKQFFNKQTEIFCEVSWIPYYVIPTSLRVSQWGCICILFCNDRLSTIKMPTWKHFRLVRKHPSLKHMDFPIVTQFFHNFRMENFQSPLARLQDCCWSWPTVTWAHSIVFQHTIASCHSSRIFWCTKRQTSRQCNSSKDSMFFWDPGCNVRLLVLPWRSWNEAVLPFRFQHCQSSGSIPAHCYAFKKAMRSMAMPAGASNCDTSPYIPYKGARNFKKLSPSSTGKQSGRMCETRCKLWLVVIWDLLGRQFWGMISLFKKHWFHHCNQEAKIGCTCCQQQSLNFISIWTGWVTKILSLTQVSCLGIYIQLSTMYSVLQTSITAKGIWCLLANSWENMSWP